MDRRNLILSILAAVGMAPSVTVAALPAQVSPDLQKFVDLIHSQQHIIDVHKTFREGIQWSVGTAKEELCQRSSVRVTELTDDLMGQMFVRFTQGDINSNEAIQQVKALFVGGSTISSLDIDYLQSILEVVVPVAVLRTLLGRHRINIQPRQMKNWERFFDVYKDIILKA